MRSLVLVALLVGCVDQPLGPDPPSARVIASWDPLACTSIDRVRVELDGELDVIAASAPCALGSVVLDVASFGAYRVRAGDGSADMRELGELVVDQPVVAWEVTP
ncbi:MAG TPA: hypothetical protein VH143_12970 [Kofleriaceae bacterium]|jgi:hypothetical protein|nr:hypothetical protein [Kofleriaceae bacterium]